MGADPRPTPRRVAPTKRPPLIPNAVFGMIIFVMAECMIFGGMVSAFNIVKSGAAAGTWPPPWQPRLPVETTAFNTFMLLSSGVALALATKLRSRRTLLLRSSFLLGAYFVLAQGFEWVQLISAGLTMKTSQHGAFFFLIVGCHALHATGALMGLGWITNRQRLGQLVDAQLYAVQVFWFFVVGIWPALYWLVYL